MTDAATLKAISNQLTLVWLVALIVGILFIPLHPFAPCVPIIAYAAIGLLLTKEQKNSDRFADSLYYLGFLLTLSALLWALLRLDKSGNALTIASDLGAGLSASILGLGMRVLIIQFRGTVTDQEEEARASIEEQAQKVRAVLEELSERWEATSMTLGKMRQDLEGFRSDLGTIHDDLLSAASSRQIALLDATAKAVAQWDAEVERIRDSLSQVAVPPPSLIVDTLRDVTRAASNEIANAAAAAAASIKSSANPMTAAAKSSQQFNEKLSALLPTLDAAVSAFHSVPQATHGLVGDLSASSSKAREGMATLEASATKLQNVTEALSGSLTSTVPVLQGLNARAASSTETLRQLEAELKASSSGITQQVSTALGDIQRVRQTTSDLVDFVTKELERPK